MNAVQEEWEKMRLRYQERYWKKYEEFRENESDEKNHGALLEMCYVLIGVFGLTAKQVAEVERNHGFTNADIKGDEQKGW